jgi:hypothetical protein
MTMSDPDEELDETASFALPLSTTRLQHNCGGTFPRGFFSVTGKLFKLGSAFSQPLEFPSLRIPDHDTRSHHAEMELKRLPRHSSVRRFPRSSGKSAEKSGNPA